MKKFILTLVLATCFFFTVRANAINSAGQLQIPVGRNFLELGDVGSWYIHGTALFTFKGPAVPQLYTYTGPRIRLSGTANLYLLGGAWVSGSNTGSDTYGLASVWFESSHCFIDKLNCFAEVDAYFNVRGLGAERGAGLYTWLTMSYQFTSDISVGLISENVSLPSFKQTALGPAITVKNATFWLAHDGQNDMVLLRVLVGL
ncbi:MAG: hypothetical protein V1763_03310 [Parcubacteria group bacterium]